MGKIQKLFVILWLPLILSSCAKPSQQTSNPINPIQNSAPKPEFLPDVRPEDMERMKQDYVKGNKQRRSGPRPSTPEPTFPPNQPPPSSPDDGNPDLPIAPPLPDNPPSPEPTPIPSPITPTPPPKPDEPYVFPVYEANPSFNIVRARLYPLYKRDVPYMDPFVANATEKKITLVNEAGLKLIGLDTKKTWAVGKQVRFDFTAQGIFVDNKKILGLTRVEVVPVEQTARATTILGLKESTHKTDGTFRFDGTFSFIRTTVVNDSGTAVNTWNIVNFVYLEDYIQAVTPSEVPAKWIDPSENAAEAVKAQSIAARSYGLNTIATSRRASKREWDVVPTTANQAYLGVRTITAQTRPLVETTAGQIVAYDNKVILAVFSANSGGHTCSSYDCWGSDLPYLQAHPDAPEVRDLPGGKRAITIENSKLIAALKSLRVIGSRANPKVQSITILKTNDSQRATQLSIVTADATYNLNPTQTTNLIKKLAIPGRFLEFSEITDNQFTVFKLGFGHAIGMSQWGAYAFSRRGLTYQQILQTYYKDTQIISLAD